MKQLLDWLWNMPLWPVIGIVGIVGFAPIFWHDWQITRIEKRRKAHNEELERSGLLPEKISVNGKEIKGKE